MKPVIQLVIIPKTPPINNLHSESLTSPQYDMFVTIS